MWGQKLSKMNKKELKQLSKSQLIEIIFQQEERIQKIENYLKAFDNPHTPSSKKNKKSKPPKGGSRFQGKPKGSSGGGIKMPEPDKYETHSLDLCPKCFKGLDSPIKTTTQKQLDLPEKLAICTEHTINHYHCNHCKTDISSANIVGRYGNRIKSFSATLKEKGLSCKEVASTVREMGFCSFSEATVVLIMVFFSNLLKPIRKLIEKSILNESYIHMDETGLRKDGQSGYVWGFFTKNSALLNAEMSRSKKIPNDLLKNYTGLSITDGYLGYDDLAQRQRCWAHILRDFKDRSKDNDEIIPIFNRAKKLYKDLTNYISDVPSKNVKNYFRFELNDIIQCLKIHIGGKKLAKKIENGGDDWFTAWNYPGAPFENNLAERGLRRIVMHRKRMGCYRNEVGKNWIDICLSVMQTWRFQNKNILQNLIMIANRT